MMHTLFDSPKEQAIADTGYADDPVELRRLPLPEQARARDAGAVSPAIRPGPRRDR
jgi:hypothetical protein